MKLGVFDIETWDLGAEFGPLLCACVLLLPEEEMVTLRQDEYVRRKKAADMTDDRQLCCDLRDLLAARHITMGYFSKGFDIPHINSRLALHGEPLLRSVLHIDPIWAFKGWRGIRARSGKMKHMAEFFGLSKQKPEVAADVWLKARGGNKAAMAEVVERCAADVRITHELAAKALDLGLIKNVGVYP